MYWHPQILVDLSLCIGVPLRFDENNVSGEFGHFTQMLVDVDLSMPLLNFVILQKQGGAIMVLVFNLCCSIGNSIGKCRQLECRTALSKLAFEKKKLVFSLKELVVEVANGKDTYGNEMDPSFVSYNPFDSLALKEYDEIICSAGVVL